MADEWNCKRLKAIVAIAAAGNALKQHFIICRHVTFVLEFDITFEHSEYRKNDTSQYKDTMFINSTKP